MAGCGYGLLSEKMLLGPGYKRISVPIFVNKTLEPDVEVVISQAYNGTEAKVGLFGGC